MKRPPGNWINYRWLITSRSRNRDVTRLQFVCVISAGLFLTIHFPRIHYFQIHVKAWLESVSCLNLDGSLEVHPILTRGPNTTDSVISAATDRSTLPLFLQDQGTLDGTKELLEKVQVGQVVICDAIHGKCDFGSLFWSPLNPSPCFQSIKYRKALQIMLEMLGTHNMCRASVRLCTHV